MKFRLSVVTARTLTIMLVFLSSASPARAFQVGGQRGLLGRVIGRVSTQQQKSMKPIHRHNFRLSVMSSSTPNSSNTSTNNNTKCDIQWKTRQKCWRPTIQDVERISWGKPAKKKGTGSRGVPHRLNHDEERKLFDQARKKGFLEVIGSGWRSQRREAPLINTYRSLCDARGQVCIVLHKGSTAMDDLLVVDLSPLRLPDTFEAVAADIISFIDLPVETVNFDFKSTKELTYDDDNDNAKEEEEEGRIEDVASDEDLAAWEERPIHQLKPYCISWKTDRSEGKMLGKKLAAVFKTAEPKASKSKKPNHVKHGKSRRSGGYGIG